MPLTTSLLATSLLLGAPAAEAPVTAVAAPAAASIALKGPGDYTLLASARGWYVAPGGDITFAGAGSSKTDLSYFNADSPKVRPAGEVRIAAGNFIIALGGANATAEGNINASDSRRIGTINVTQGDALSTNLDYTTVQGIVGYKVYENAFNSGGTTLLRLYAVGGGRFSDTSFDVTRLAGGKASIEITTGEPIIGALAELTLAEQFHIDLQVTGGGWSKSQSFDVAAVFGYTPVPWLSLEVGYRLLANNVKQDSAAGETKLNASYAGLLFGATFRF